MTTVRTDSVYKKKGGGVMVEHPMELKGAAKGRQTQWAGQFLAASEMIRRGYTVAFTTGNNTPVADLMVGSPRGDLFWVDVKGQSGKRDWLVRPKDLRDKLFYVLVALSPLSQVPGRREADRFFVLTQQEANALEAEYRRQFPANKTTMPGFKFMAPSKYEDRWEKLLP